MAKKKSKIMIDIEEYCNLNGIKNIDEFVEYLLKTAFYIEKYGITPIPNISGNSDKKNENKKLENKINNENSKPKNKIKIVKLEKNNEK